MTSHKFFPLALPLHHTKWPFYLLRFSRYKLLPFLPPPPPRLRVIIFNVPLFFVSGEVLILNKHKNNQT